MMVLAAFAAALLGIGTPAPAPTAAPIPPRGSTDFDVQCMLVTQQLVNNSKVDAKAKSQITLAMIFYFGRVDQAVSGDALKARIRTAAKALQGHAIAPLLKDCGQFMTARGAAMQKVSGSIGAELKPAAK